MADLVDYEPTLHEAVLRQLLTEYLEEGAASLREIGLEEDIPALVTEDLAHHARFTPPNGRQLLAFDGDVAVGCGAMRLIGPGVAEIKRMYLQPNARGRGLGRMLLDGLLHEARALGCHEARLDSGWFMTDAHRLDEAAGFTECEPYQESEVPEDFDARWKYMRLGLEPT